MYKYQEIKPPVKLLFLGWNPPKPFGGFWFDDKDNLRNSLHEILKKLGEITASYPNDFFLEEFLEEGFRFTHTVKCWTESRFPGFGRDTNIKGAGIRKKEIGIPLIRCCVRTHLDKELKALAPEKVCAFGEVSFVGLCELFPGLAGSGARPTGGRIFQRGEYEIPWPLLYTCLPLRIDLRDIALGHLQEFL